MMSNLAVKKWRALATHMPRPRRTTSTAAAGLASGQRAASGPADGRARVPIVPRLTRAAIAAGIGLAAAGAAVAFAGPAQAGGFPGFPGAVYTMTNSAAGNAIEAFGRAADGSLAPAGTYPTGGDGGGAGLRPLDRGV
jgi:hypothetical protein